MSRVSPFRKALLRDKAQFASSNVVVSKDGASWNHMASVSLTESGCIFGEMADGSKTLLLAELQSCHVSINPSVLSANNAQRRRFVKHRPDQENTAGQDDPPVIHVRTFNEKLYIETCSRSQFGYIMSALLAWQNMKPQGLAKKWFAQNKAYNSSSSTTEAHELLVCRCKIYGPIPAKGRNVNLVSGPKAPLYMDEIDTSSHSGSHPSSTMEGYVNEGWFYTMGVLKSNGMLNFITELDGTLLYSIDMRKILSSEIRELHHSICNSANTLFIGVIKDLRLNNVIKSTSAVTAEALAQSAFLTKDDRPVASNSRILIEFPLHIDLEDWFVGLNYFCKREYIGVYNENSSYTRVPATRVVDLEGTLEADNTFDSTHSKSTQRSGPNNVTVSSVEEPAQQVKPELSNFARDYFKVSKVVTLDIIEAKFDNISRGSKVDGKIYAEVVMWGYPWAKTSIVNHSHNPFWKEEFSTDLPISTQMIRIVIKKSLDGQGYSISDRIIGTVYVTPDILTQKVGSLSTMMVETNAGDSISVPGFSSSSTNLATAANAPPNRNIVRLSIYDAGNVPVGKLLLTVDLKEYLILPPSDFRTLESMLFNCPMKQLIEYFNSVVGAADLENVSYILLDIFQSLGIEERWFKALIEVELVTVDKVTRQNYAKKGASSAQSNNVFNTLFRGSSIFTKSLERYIFRIGQEYLEKVFGNFFEKISTEKKNCEIDPRYVRLQEKARRRGKDPQLYGESDNGDEDTDESDEECDSDEERRREEIVNTIVETNFENLYAYTEEIWTKIYTTSNDLPQQIKSQLKHFRTKVDFACDPEDKTTSLNCLSAFIFLRFFCPAILNPKLFYLTKDHQTGQAQRTLTVIAKILLNLANRQEFSPHKEAHLVKMNKFLEKHEHEVLDYFDKISGRKNDFNEKILSLSHEMKRFDLGLSGDSTSSELPTTPYLIDKSLRLTELIHLLQFNGIQSRGSRLAPSISSTSVTTTVSSGNSPQRNSQATSGPHKTSQHEREASSDSTDDIHVNNERNVYQIGSLEFEKSEFLDLVGDNETEGFIKSLCRSNEEIFSFITSNITLKDLQKQSTNLVKKITDLAQSLQKQEFCSNLQHDESLWEAFVDNVVSNAYLEPTKNSVVYFDSTFQDAPLPGQRRLADNGLSSLRLKFPSENKGNLTETFSSTSIGGSVRRSTKNPFKRWLKRV